MGLFDMLKNKADTVVEPESCDAARFPGEPRDGFKSKAYYLGELQRVENFQRRLESATLNEDGGRERYVYTGSYDFRLTAVAKVLGIDKDALANSKFIAADLLDGKAW